MEDVSQGGILLRVARQQRTNESRDLFSVWASLCNNRTGFSVRGPCRATLWPSTLHYVMES
jgi:hypothetical protein